METTDIILRLENVVYDADEFAPLTGITFELAWGEDLVVFGPEDSGLNTLCPLIAGLALPAAGEIYFKSAPIKGFDYFQMHRYRKELGYLQRDYGLISNMSAEQNIRLPLQYHSTLSSAETRAVADSSTRSILRDAARGGPSTLRCRRRCGRRSLDRSSSSPTCSWSSTPSRGNALSTRRPSCASSSAGPTGPAAP